MKDRRGLLFSYRQEVMSSKISIRLFSKKITTQNGHSNQITISANTNTLKAVFILENGYQVDFRPQDSISSVLGFNNDLYTTDYQESEML